MHIHCTETQTRDGFGWRTRSNTCIHRLGKRNWGDTLTMNHCILTEVTWIIHFTQSCRGLLARPELSLSSTSAQVALIPLSYLVAMLFAWTRIFNSNTCIGAFYYYLNFMCLNCTLVFQMNQILISGAWTWHFDGLLTTTRRLLGVVTTLDWRTVLFSFLRPILRVIFLD